MSESTPNNGYVISFLTLRKAVGILGMALPFVLIIGYLLFHSSSLHTTAMMKKINGVLNWEVYLLLVLLCFLPITIVMQLSIVHA
jgi:uncharacterized membrane protein YecN with MAPEG domain